MMPDHKYRGERTYWLSFLGVVFVLACLIRYHIRSFIGEVRRQGISSTLIVSTRNVLIDMVDIETGLRGYLIVGRREFLRPYHEGLGRFQYDISEFTSAASANPNTKTFVENCVLISRDILGEFHNQVEVSESIGIDAARERFIKFPTKPGMDKIRENLSRVQAEENRKIIENSRSIESSMRTTSTILDLFIGTFFAIFMAMLSGVVNPPTRPETARVTP